MTNTATILGACSQPVQPYGYHSTEYTTPSRNYVGPKYVSENGPREEGDGQQTFSPHPGICHVGTARALESLIT
jgi:hypothetical protein